MYKKFLMLFLAFMVSGIILISCSDDSSSPAPDRVITIISPNGGEILEVGTVVEITWTDNISEEVKIELFDGAEGIEIESSTESDGSYDYTIPAGFTAGPYVVKITSVSNAGVYDFSDDAFAITPPAASNYVVVTTPNGGETWEMNTTQTITWTSNISDADVAIELYSNGILNGVIIASTENDGSYDYVIPTDLSEDDDYKVRVTGLTTNIFDSSNNDFEIRPEGDFISVLSPNGGEEWEMGTTEIIFWNDNIDDNVKIELINGLTTTVIASSTPSDGSFDYAIPINLDEGSNFEIKITSVAVEGITDTSDDDFTIDPVPGYIRVISPNGGERYDAGTTQTVRWEDNIDGNVVVYLEGNYEIAYYTASDGLFEFHIPLDAEASDLYTIVIASSIDGNIYDESDDYFTIIAAPPSIQVGYPNGGEELVIGETYWIYWQDNINGNVMIEFYENGTLIPESTIDNAGNDGSYQLTIPFDAEPTDNLTMKIISIGDPSIFDWSDGEFAVVGSDVPIPDDFVVVSSIPHTDTYEINPEDDIDWYRVYLDSGSEYFFENTSTENLDTAFGLYIEMDTNLVEVAYNDDGGGDWQPEILYTAPLSGYYYLKVAYFYNVKEVKKEKQTGNTGPYTLTIDEIPYGK
ncbi:MAG: hypothetical protein PF574_09595 [Candidatus Delongbacteria bacterium]|jgi:hypothetical protein|nr:hypothetical protein [Candidatus Delongbacteria bacterium]